GRNGGIYARGLAQKGARFADGLAATVEASVEPDEIEQIAIFGRGHVGPASPAFPPKFDEQAAAAFAGNIAYDPVASRTPAVRQVSAAHRLGLIAEAARQFRCRAHVMPPGFRQRMCQAGDTAGKGVSGCRRLRGIPQTETGEAARI